MRFIVLANGAINAAGHHLNNNLGLKGALEALGMQTLVLAHRQADAELCGLLQAAPVISYSPYERASKDPLCGDVESCYLAGNTLCNELLASVDQIGADDVIVITTTTQNELFACARLFELLPASRRPRLFLNFTFENFLAKEGTGPGPLATLYRFAARLIAANSSPQRVLFSANSVAMANVLGRIIGFQVHLLPIPKSYPAALHAESADAAYPLPCVGILGDMGTYKGFNLIPQLIRANPGVRWLVQEPRDGCEKHWGEDANLMRGHPGVALLKSGVPPDEYYGLFARVDIILTPYDKNYKRLQTSGIFAEAVASGKIVIAPSTPWVLEQQRRAAWAGEIFPEQTEAHLSAALNRVAGRFVELRDAAQRLAPAWRESQSVKQHVAGMLRYFSLDANGARP